MKRILILLAGLLLLAAVLLWLIPKRSPTKSEEAAEPKTKEAESAGPKISRDTNGNVQIRLPPGVQDHLRIATENPVASQMRPHLKGYGRVLDPAPLAALVLERSSAQAAYAASSNELVRLKTMEGQGNASIRSLQTATATALRDQLAVESVDSRLRLTWGKSIANQPELDSFTRKLAGFEVALVRIDLPAGQRLDTAPPAAQVRSGSGAEWPAEYLGPAPNVDAQMQGQGFFLLVSSGNGHLVPGEALVGELETEGQPLTGVIIPRSAVVRTDGTAWIYEKTAEGTFTRIAIGLERPTEAGWFVMEEVSTHDLIVVSGAQLLLSAESRGEGGE